MKRPKHAASELQTTVNSLTQLLAVMVERAGGSASVTRDNLTAIDRIPLEIEMTPEAVKLTLRRIEVVPSFN